MEIAISAARWVVGRALSPATDGLLESWAASSELGTKIRDLKMELLYAQGMLDNSRGRDLRSPALAQLLLELRQLAYSADDAMDELEYFRIQDELDGTYETTDVEAQGLLQGLVLNARHTARVVAGKLKLCSCSCAAGSHGYHGQEEEDEKKGCFPRACSCGGKRADEISSSPPPNQGVQDGEGGCMPKVIGSKVRNSASAVGKLLPCYSHPSVQDDPSTGMLGSKYLCNTWSSKSQRKHDTDAPKLKFDRVEMSKKMTDIIDQLKPICAKVSTILGLELFGSDRTTSQRGVLLDRPQTNPLITDPKIYGRENQINKVVDSIIGDKYSTNVITLLPVVGLGGIGKTTFTQHIYDKLKSHFQVLIWICVSHDFNATKLTQEIIKQLPEKENGSDDEKIEKIIHSRKFLLVLDDMWTYHEDEWKKLLAPFRKVGTTGNMVIVTTRIPEVAKMVGTKDCSINLERLDPEDCMLLFKACVFGNQESWEDHPDLHETGEKIVDKLKGSPLAVKTVGRLLRSQLKSEHWNRVLESREWESQTNNDDIMPALKLSYNYLPFYLQQCFSHCALFPEDYEFESEELIHFWIGLELLGKSDQNEHLEDIGQKNLDSLVNHGFFKKCTHQFGYTYYVIHDLLHELAVNVSSYECLSINESNVRSIQIPLSLRHLSITVDNRVLEDRNSFDYFKVNLSALDKKLKAENLRTLMLFGPHESFVKTFRALFRKAKALRVILLPDASYSVQELLHNHTDLLHLRYLRVYDVCSASNISRFYHLCVLHTESFDDPSSLLRDTSNLVNLRHFRAHSDGFHSSISEVGKMKSLQELKRFEVKRETYGFELQQLGKLLELRGSLAIYNLERVQSKKEADETKLAHINHLHGLTLDWDIDRSDKNPKLEEDILESLKPHSNLRELGIRGHGGATFPTWLGAELSVENLESLSLEGVAWNTLPLPGKLYMVKDHSGDCLGCVLGEGFKNLKRLELANIPGLKKWHGNGTNDFLSHLEDLSVRNCSELMELPFQYSAYCCQSEQEENMTCFPKLTSITIFRCPKLLSLPPIPWSSTMWASITDVGSGPYALQCHSKKIGCKITELYINGNGAIFNGNGASDSTLWNSLAYSNLTDLESLSIHECPPMPLDQLQVLASLKSLSIYNTSNVLCPAEIESNARYQFPVEYLVIRTCGADGKELTELLSYFPKLSKMVLDNCDKVTELGVAEQHETRTPECTPLASASRVDEEENKQQHRQSGEEKDYIEAAASGMLLLPPQIQHLVIIDCPVMSIPSSSINGATEGGLCSLRLQSLSIYNSSARTWRSNSSACAYFPVPISLQELNLKGMEDIRTIAPLPNLTKLSIRNCGGLRCDSMWPVVQGHLTELEVLGSPKFFEPSRLFETTQDVHRFSRLQTLVTDDVEGVLAVPICLILSASLTQLVFRDLKTESLTKDQEEALQILTSLQELRIFQCPKLQSLPAMLSELPNLKILEIYDCPSFLSLPKDRLPSALVELDVSKCKSRELTRQCRKLTGTIPILKA